MITHTRTHTSAEPLSLQESSTWAGTLADCPYGPHSLQGPAAKARGAQGPPWAQPHSLWALLLGDLCAGLGVLILTSPGEQTGPPQTWAPPWNTGPHDCAEGLPACAPASSPPDPGPHAPGHAGSAGGHTWPEDLGGRWNFSSAREPDPASQRATWIPPDPASCRGLGGFDS